MPDHLSEAQLRALNELDADYQAIHDEDPDLWDELKQEAAAWQSMLFMGAPDEADDGAPNERPRIAPIEPYPPEFDDEKPLVNFGRLLVRLRQESGYASQDAVVESVKSALQGNGKRLGRLLSKSMLSLYERGEVKNLKPETLWLLAQVYRTDYQRLARYWAEERLHVKFSEAAGFVHSITSKSCRLRIGASSERTIQIISVDELCSRQEGMTTGSHVGVAAIDFLDDDIFFDMVLRNLKNGVRYTYLLPRHTKSKFESFIARIETADAQLGHRIERELQLDGNDPLIRWIARPDRDYPVNYTVMIPANGTRVEAYVGLLEGDRVQYLQVADLHLARLLVNSFNWTITLFKCPTIMAAIRRLELRVEEDELQEQEKQLKADEAAPEPSHTKIDVGGVAPIAGYNIFFGGRLAAKSNGL